MRTVVPTGGKVTPALLLGWASADFSAAEAECVALAFAFDVGDVVDEADPVLEAEEAVLWVAVPDAAPVVEVVELDDPPHAVSSSTSELSPVATVHPLLRITCLSFRRTRGPDPVGYAGSQPANVMALFGSLITCHLPSTPLPLVLSGLAPLNVYRGMPL
jgi:hypothetical protein